AIGLEPQTRLGAPRGQAAGRGEAGVTAGARIGLLGSDVEPLLDLLAILLQLFRARLARHVHNGTHGEAQARAGQIELHPAPGIEGEVALGGDGYRKDWPAGLLRGHDDAEAGA